VSIPEGAGSQIAKRQPVLILGIEDVQDTSKDADLKLDAKSLQAAKAMVEAMLPRMKRFTVYSVYNDGGIRKGRELSDTGLAAEMDPGQIPPADLYLNITAAINSEVNVDKTQAEEYVVCTATVIYTLTDDKQKVLEDTQHASGTIRSPKPGAGQSMKDMKNVRTRVRMFDPASGKWRFMGGFDPKDSASATALVRQTIEDPLKGLVAKLALALPVTTQVTAINPSKTQFAVRAGQKNGIFKGTKVVVWCDQGDFSYAIAETVAEPTADKSNLKVVSWNDADPDAKEIIAKIKAGGIPDDLKDKIWATTEGIPIEEMLAP
jgi:hypothetical protein